MASSKRLLFADEYMDSTGWKGSQTSGQAVAIASWNQAASSKQLTEAFSTFGT